MSVSNKVTKTWSRGSDQLSGTVTYTADGQITIEDTVAGSTTNKLYSVTIAQATLKGIYILSDQDMTLKVNSTSLPVPSAISLKANTPYEWTADGYFDCPFTADVTAMYFTNAGSTTANLSVRLLGTV